jgi:hypothetical protein
MKPTRIFIELCVVLKTLNGKEISHTVERKHVNLLFFEDFCLFVFAQDWRWRPFAIGRSQGTMFALERDDWASIGIARMEID